MKHQDEAGGMAAGEGNSLRIFYQCTLAFFEFRQTVYPAVCDPMCRRTVDNAHRGAFNQADGLTGGVVRKAEKGYIDAVKQFSPGVRILAFFLRYFDYLNVAAVNQTLLDFQA